MQKIKRDIKSEVLERLSFNPAVALLGPRQVGKSTLAKEIVDLHEDAVYLDLEIENDRFIIEKDPELFLEQIKVNSFA